MPSHFWRNMGFAIVLIRFAVFVPAIIYWGYTGDHLKLISSNPELQDHTHNSAILVGQKLADKWATILFIWNLLIWWPALMCFPPLNLPFTIVDTAITVFLSKATHYHIGYKPLTLETCRDPVGLELQRPAGTNESFFAAAGRLNETMASSTAMCLEFSKEAQYAIALSILYALASLIGILAFPCAIREFRKNDESILTMAKEVVSLTGTCLTCMIKWPMIVIVGALVYTPVLIFRCLPMDFKAPVRSARRHAAKTTIGAEQKIELKLKELGNDANQRGKTVGQYQGSSGTHNGLSQFLGVYDMLVMVAQHLHHSDLISLSTVSKSVREAVLPSGDVSRRLAIFRRYTCEPGQRTTCWGCANQICDGCEEISPIPETIIFHHLDHCVPYCTSCYHTHIVRDSRVQRGKTDGTPVCRCAPKRKFAQRRQALWSIFNRHAYYTQSLDQSWNHRQICRHCSQLDSTELASRKAQGALTTLRKGLKSDGKSWKRCAVVGCGRELGRGPRYWVCTRYSCHKECKSSVHQAWGSRADASVDGEGVV